MQQRRICCQARLDFRAAVVFVKPGMQVHQVVEHLSADVGDDTFADPGDQIKPGEGADREAQDQQHEQSDGVVEQICRLGHEALINQQLDALPHR